MTIDDVIIRVSEKFSLAMHMDYDEAMPAPTRRVTWLYYQEELGKFRGVVSGECLWISIDETPALGRFLRKWMKS